MSFPLYSEFLERKRHSGEPAGFDPAFMPAAAFPHQSYLIDWNCRMGRSADFADCGTGKSLVIEAFAENVVRKTNGRFLILDPVAVAPQMVSEGEKFGIEVIRSREGKVSGPGVYVTNYERLHHFDPNDFVGCACDESGILKDFDGVTRSAITEFMKKLPYRLLATATPAPNDFFELGTSSEALGHMGYMDILNRFFKNDLNNSASGRMHGKIIQWRFKGHAEEPFWRFICSWARVMRKPSDLGFDDGPFVLPPLIENNHVIESEGIRPGWLFPTEAVGMREEREEARLNIARRCEKVAELCAAHPMSLVWAETNTEGDMLTELIPGAVQVSGSDRDEVKEERLMAFANGEIKKLVTKRSIAAWGMNLQRCAHIGGFVTHSFEQTWQGIRRCWRFGQTQPVTVDTVLTEGQRRILENQKRKAAQNARMFAALVDNVQRQLGITKSEEFPIETEVPAWL